MSPLILAIETSQQSCGVALRNANGVYGRQEMAAKQHAKLLLPMIEQLFTDTELTLQQVDAVAFACGPGSFTGARIAASVTQGLAYAANAQAIAISSTLSLAHSYAQQNPANYSLPLFILIDAHMGEYYAACYQFGSDGFPVDTLLPDSLLSDQQLISALERHENATVLGSGIETFLAKPDTGLSAKMTQRLQDIVESDRAMQATASSVLALAESAWQAGDTHAPEHAIPVYLRERTAWKTVEQQNSLTSESK